jgi:hypothetical protein
MQPFSIVGNSIYAHFLTLFWFLWMKAVSLGRVLIALPLSTYTSHFNFRHTVETNSFTMLHKWKTFPLKHFLFSVSYAERKENSTEGTARSEATLRVK